MGQLARVKLHYDQPEPDAPASLIAKFPTYGPDNRVIADLFRMYETETRFYEEVANKVELRTPRRYHSARAADSTDFILLMEDLAPARVGDQVVGCSPAQAELAIRELAKFHATWWESPRLAELDWVWAFNHPVRVAAAQGAYEQAWAPFKQIWAKQVPAPVMELGERFSGALPKLLDRLAAHPVTISHGDYRLDNLFFATPEGGDPLAVVDWQIMTLGNGLFDVAYFMAGAMPPADRRAMEMDLLHMYHDILIGARRQGIRLRPVPARLPYSGDVLLAVRGHHPRDAGRLERARTRPLHRPSSSVLSRSSWTSTPASCCPPDESAICHARVAPMSIEPRDQILRRRRWCHHRLLRRGRGHARHPGGFPEPVEMECTFGSVRNPRRATPHRLVRCSRRWFVPARRTGAFDR